MFRPPAPAIGFVEFFRAGEAKIITNWRRVRPHRLTGDLRLGEATVCMVSSTNTCRTTSLRRAALQINRAGNIVRQNAFGLPERSVYIPKPSIAQQLFWRVSYEGFSVALARNCAVPGASMLARDGPTPGTARQ
jgi:hypothetical protein